MNALSVLIVGFDKEYSIKFSNKSAAQLERIVGFNKFYSMLIKVLMTEASDLKLLIMGNWQIEINKKQNYIAVRSGDTKAIYSYSFDYIQNYKDESCENIFILNSISDSKEQELLKLNDQVKATNAVIEMDKRKAEFYTNISHEFRTPLNVIMGTHQLINERLSSGDFIEIMKNNEKYRSIINKNCYRLLRLVNNLIDVSKIDSGHYKMELSNCNIVSFVEGIVESVVSYAECKKINLIFDTDVEEKIISIDRDKLERAILNLLSNAIKFTPAGGSIEVSICDKLDTVEISVKDSGIGIPKDKQDIIFERYKQLDCCSHKGVQGSGIGLSIVKSIVELHMGKIAVTSETSQGSEFRIVLPAMFLEGVKLVEQDYSERDASTDINLELSNIGSECYEYN